MTAPAPAGLAPLKPCPLCGESDGVYLDDPGPTHPHSAIVRCSGCNAVQCHNTAAEAIAAWNARAPSLPVPPAEAALRCVEDIAMDAGTKLALVERITAALASAAEPTEAQLQRVDAVLMAFTGATLTRDDVWRLKHRVRKALEGGR